MNGYEWGTKEPLNKIKAPYEPSGMNLRRGFHRYHQCATFLASSTASLSKSAKACRFCVRLHDARIHGKSLAFDETHLHRSDDDALENVAQNIALTEPVQSVLGEGRVVGNGVIEIEPAEPSGRFYQTALFGLIWTV